MKLDKISIQNKYRIIGTVLILAIILIYNLYNDNIKTEYQNNLKDYPDSKQIEKDIEEKFNEYLDYVILNKKSMSSIINFGKGELKNIEYEKENEKYLEIKADFIYEGDFSYKIPLRMGYEFDGNKYVYDYMVEEQGDEELVLINCDKEYKNERNQTRDDIVYSQYRDFYDSIEYNSSKLNDRGQCIYIYDAKSTDFAGDPIKNQIEVKFYIREGTDGYFYDSSYEIKYNAK